MLEPGCEFTYRERRVLLQKVFVQVTYYYYSEVRQTTAHSLSAFSGESLSEYSETCIYKDHPRDQKNVILVHSWSYMPGCALTKLSL